MGLSFFLKVWADLQSTWWALYGYRLFHLRKVTTLPIFYQSSILLYQKLSSRWLYHKLWSFSYRLCQSLWELSPCIHTALILNIYLLSTKCLFLKAQLLGLDFQPFWPSLLDASTVQCHIRKDNEGKFQRFRFGSVFLLKHPVEYFIGLFSKIVHYHCRGSFFQLDSSISWLIKLFPNQQENSHTLGRPKLYSRKSLLVTWLIPSSYHSASALILRTLLLDYKLS